MDITSIFFYIFSAVMLFAAFKVITSRNPVHSALYLVLCFFQASAIWMLLQAEFLSITLILVYVGAVMVLFLFVVMMLDINIEAMRKGFWSHFPLAASIGAVLALELASVLLGGFRLTQAPATAVMPEGQQYSNTKELGVVLYTEYLYPLEIAAVILLVAIVAAIALTLRERKDSKAQNPSDQVRVKAADRIQLVKMAPVHQPLSTEAEEGKAP
ncbi:MAG: NADH-quinone oxidoreductase subunit J [Betaproteobacteria bacterium]|nr:NADH-quinone oxidoreductase subunit J [Betaproteobacteria bacterium]NBY32650.1 NADH-quinone oxidoreductase subunit J [Betaproteobacteria bacterium]